MNEQQEVTTPRALWMLIVVAPVIVAAEMQTNFVLVRQACSVQRNIALYVVIVVSLVLTALTAFVAFTVWRRAGALWPTEAADLATRIRFVAVLGILSSVISFLVIVAQGIATIHFDPCQL
jgi:vacuolar-type H+-ATPase subunit I/STV1